MESGFYKLDNDELLFAPNYVSAPTFTLVREEKDTYTYPQDGWIWAETQQEALNLLSDK